MPQSFSHRSAFERSRPHTGQLYLASDGSRDQIRTRQSMRQSERQAYQQLSDSVVRHTPMVPPDYSKPVGYFLIVLATAIGVCQAFVWALVKLFELS